MYIKMAAEEDNKMTNRWQKDADGILIFVSPKVSLHMLRVLTSGDIVDWVVLCLSRSISRSVGTGLETKSTGYLGILSQEYLSASR
jgi:hypothetical protein